MQVFGLLGHVIRSGRAASRLIDAETANIAAAIRRDAVVRWRQAIALARSARVSTLPGWITGRTGGAGDRAQTHVKRGP